MRILVFGPKEPMGGVETVALSYAEQLIKQGAQCDFLVYESYPLLEERIASIGGTVVRATSRRVDYSQYKADIAAVFANTMYDAVWCNYSGLTNIDLLKTAKKVGVPIRIVHSHVSALSWGNPLMRVLVPLLHHKNKRVIDAYATDFWACSKMAGEFMFPKKVWGKLYVCNNAIDLLLFQPSEDKRQQFRKQHGWENAFVIGHIGRICREKNQYFLLDVFKAFTERHSDAKLLFLSDDANSDIVAYAKQLGVYEHCVFLTGSQELPALYNAMDVFMLPSVIEGLGLTLVEAQACGVPCVASTGASEEANATGYVTYVSLEEPIDTWCSALNKTRGKRIDNPHQAIAEHHFDIETESKTMYDFLKESL